MLSGIIIPGQLDKPLVRLNNNCANIRRQVTLTYGDLFPANVIQDMGVSASDNVTVTLHKSSLYLRWISVGYLTYSYGAKYPTDSNAFLELHLNDSMRTVPTYELQMNDALNYGSSSYNNAASVSYIRLVEIYYEKNNYI